MFDYLTAKISTVLTFCLKYILGVSASYAERKPALNPSAGPVSRVISWRAEPPTDHLRVKLKRDLDFVRSFEVNNLGQEVSLICKSG